MTFCKHEHFHLIQASTAFSNGERDYAAYMSEKVYMHDRSDLSSLICFFCYYCSYRYVITNEVGSC